MMKNVIEIPALTYLDAKYGEEKVDQMLKQLKEMVGLHELDYLFNLTNEDDIEFVIEEVK